MGESPKWALTYLPKNDRLGKSRSRAISFIDFDECFNCFLISFTTNSLIQSDAVLPLVRLHTTDKYFGVIHNFSA